MILNAIICTVTVVPMSAPSITPSVWPNSIIPEFTNPISITVVAVEDWVSVVIIMPRTRA